MRSGHLNLRSTSIPEIGEFAFVMEDAACRTPLQPPHAGLLVCCPQQWSAVGPGGAPLRLYQKWVFIQTNSKAHTRKFLDSLQVCIYLAVIAWAVYQAVYTQEVIMELPSWAPKLGIRLMINGNLDAHHCLTLWVPGSKRKKVIIYK